MSQSPTAPGAAASSDWRADVHQSSRNKQVREIATVLASLEPGASSTSKLRLAMQFEDTVFKAAGSLADYQKTISKRLKKLQKNYVPTQPASATEKQRTLDSLRQMHGESIRYVLKHAKEAVAEMKLKHGEEKARQLEQHLDSAKTWARDLGLLDSSTTNKPNYNMADDLLERLKSNIERRLENLRAHVVKLADPERFFVETLEKAEEDCKAPATSQFVATETRKFHLSMIKPGSTFDPNAMMKEALDVVIHKTIPLPTRSQHNDEKAALIHLEKMRAASMAFLAFMALENKSSTAVAPPKLLKKLNAVVTDGIQFVTEVMKEHRKQSTEAEVSLQDAWMKPLLDPNNASANMAESSSEPDGSAGKRIRLSGRPNVLVLRSRVLLNRGRKTPPNLLVELQRKGVKLVRPTHGQGSHLILEFDQVFSMTIYLIPLLVEVRACQRKEQSATTNASSDDADKDQPPSLVSSLVPTPTWMSLHYGLTSEAARMVSSTAKKENAGLNKKRSRNFEEAQDAKDSSTNNPSTNNESTNDDSNKAAAISDSQNDLTVWNVKGDYQTIGHVVEERLRDASAHATHVLRQCFTNAVVKETAAKNDFELEILEGQGLLNFLHLARSTYTPNWKDVSV
ncbi:hypothetical protein ACA910_002922 [Epithemia clementina (nom. ined.)]